MNASGRPNTCKSRGPAMGTGGRVRNAYTTYPQEGDSGGKLPVIPHGIIESPGLIIKVTALEDGCASD